MIMETATAGAVMKEVIGRIFRLFEEEYNKQKNLMEETMNIRDELRMFTATMGDRHALGRSELPTHAERLYMEEMLVLAREAQDFIDRILDHLEWRSRGVKLAKASLVKRIVHRMKQAPTRLGFPDEIEKLKTRLCRAHKRFDDAKPNTSVVSSGHRTSCCDVTDNPLGIGEPKDELRSLLEEVADESEKLRVISIVGFSGLGKTTLARAVYETAKVEKKFDCYARVDAGHSLETNVDGVSKILRSIVGQVDVCRPRDAMDVDDDDQRLQESLTEHLKDKRYFIVIDDIGIEQWSTIESILKDNGKSSRILLTTTIQSTARRCSHGDGYVYQLKTLDAKQSKELALGKVISPELEEGSEALLQKCDGLPLALVSVSNFLKSRLEKTGKECAKLCRSLGSQLRDNSEVDGHAYFTELRKKLQHNFDSLPVHAMNCLQYLSIFPNSRPLKRKVIIRRWLAQGYARDSSIRSEKDIADDTFNALIDRNIIQSIDTRNNAQVKTCKIHGIMHEFVLHKSVAQGFIVTWPRDHPRYDVNMNNTCHLSIRAGHETNGDASREDLSHVRSLTVFGKAGDAISYVRKCKLLQVLDLEECNDLEESDLKHIGRLEYLRYLSIGGTTGTLLSSIARLPCLKTLDLGRTWMTLPIAIIMMDHLVHLFGRFTVDIDHVKNPTKMENIEKFLSKKSNLETLAGFHTSKGQGQGFLQLLAGTRMQKLRKVKIWCDPVVSERSLSKAIQKFATVPLDIVGAPSLSLDAEKCSEDFLRSLDFEPCPEGFKYDIQSLKLDGKLPQLPPFVPLLSDLTELSISSPTLTWHLLSSLVTLDNLLYLKLVAPELENFEMRKGACPSLQRLCLVVQHITSTLPAIEEGALPNLVSLQLLCPGLVGLSGIQIRHLKYLKEVMVDSSVCEQTKNDWKEATQNHPNRPRLLFGHDEASAVRGKRKICIDQPGLDEEAVDSVLKKLKLSESTSQLEAINNPGHPVRSRGEMPMPSTSSTN